MRAPELIVVKEITSGDVACKVASGTIARRINKRKADTPILVQRWVEEKSRMGVHANCCASLQEPR